MPCPTRDFPNAPFHGFRCPCCPTKRLPRCSPEALGPMLPAIHLISKCGFPSATSWLQVLVLQALLPSQMGLPASFQLKRSPCNLIIESERGCPSVADVFKDGCQCTCPVAVALSLMLPGGTCGPLSVQLPSSQASSHVFTDGLERSLLGAVSCE